ncbi:hypothetical protein Trydic_g6289 [Trypoxylus dichotomus]
MFEITTNSLLKHFVRSNRVETLAYFNDVQLLEKFEICYQNLTVTLRRFNRTISCQLLFLMGSYFANMTVRLLALVQEGISSENIASVVLGVILLMLKEMSKLCLLLKATDSCQKQVPST